MRREGLQARGIYKEVPRPSRRLGLATRQKIPYNCRLGIVYNIFSFIYFRAVKISFPYAFSRKLFQQLVLASLIARKY